MASPWECFVWPLHQESLLGHVGPYAIYQGLLQCGLPGSAKQQGRDQSPDFIKPYWHLAGTYPFEHFNAWPLWHDNLELTDVSFFLLRIFTVIPSLHIWQIVKVQVEGNRTPEYRHINKKDITKATELLKFKNILKDHQLHHYQGSPMKQPKLWNYLKKCIRVATLLHFHQSIIKFPLLFLQSKEDEIQIRFC